MGCTVFIRDQSLGNEGEEEAKLCWRSPVRVLAHQGPVLSQSHSVTGHVSPGQDVALGEAGFCSGGRPEGGAGRTLRWAASPSCRGRLRARLQHHCAAPMPRPRGAECDTVWSRGDCGDLGHSHSSAPGHLCREGRSRFRLRRDWASFYTTLLVR